MPSRTAAALWGFAAAFVLPALLVMFLEYCGAWAARWLRELARELLLVLSWIACALALLVWALVLPFSLLAYWVGVAILWLLLLPVRWMEDFGWPIDRAATAEGIYHEHRKRRIQNESHFRPRCRRVVHTRCHGL